MLAMLIVVVVAVVAVVLAAVGVVAVGVVAAVAVGAGDGGGAFGCAYLVVCCVCFLAENTVSLSEFVVVAVVVFKDSNIVVVIAVAVW